MTPFRLDIKVAGCVPIETYCAQAALHQEYPKIKERAWHGRKLAVVGAGPLVVHDLEELRTWDGDIWAINSAARWLHENGVRATLVTIDPLDIPGEFPMMDALVATCCHPNLFQKLEGKNVWTFDLIETHPETGLAGGCTTATRTPALAIKLGYRDVSYFGCEASYDGDRDHIDFHNGEAQEVIVRAGGRDYRAETGLLVQCQDFMQLFTTFPDAFKNRSGGLLKAMIDNPDTWEIVAVSAAMKQHLEEVNGKQGLYEGIYEPIAA